MESFLGSVWFAMMMGLVGYLAGHMFPMSKLMDMFKK